MASGARRPIPSVGALIVKDGIVVGRGWTADGGRPHGEIVALARAGAAARGATLYVTLEPCSHRGRTGPCCEAIGAAGVSRVVYAVGDPNPLVAGRGAAYCRAQGLAVEEGVGAVAARRDHAGHIAVMTKHRPMVTLKLAETADGFVAGGPHDPRLAITGIAANGVVHAMRATHDAIMVGIGTILADDPLMTVRLPGVVAKPLRVVLDRQARLPPQSRLLQTALEAPIAVFVDEAAPAGRMSTLSATVGVTVHRTRLAPDGRIDLSVVLSTLAKQGITRVFSEGGPTVAAALIAAEFGRRHLHFLRAAPTWRGGCADPLPAGSGHSRRHHAFRSRRNDEIRCRPPRPLGKHELMFTGLVTDIGTVESMDGDGNLRRARIVCDYVAETIAVGASIACNGPCLTVVDVGRRGNRTWIDVDIGAETLARTTAGTWHEGMRLNLERSLKIGDELGGHIVTGHIDGVAEILSIDAFDGMSRFEIRVPVELSRFIAEKGSISLDGTSLTVNSVGEDTLSVLLIPHTLDVTTWGERRGRRRAEPGDRSDGPLRGTLGGRARDERRRKCRGPAATRLRSW